MYARTRTIARFEAFLFSCVILSGCGSATERLEPRFVAVQNAVSALGLAQSGPISEGSLAEGGEARITQRFEAGECYLFVAFGNGDARDLSLRVLDPTGTELGGGATSNTHTAINACARTAGDHQIVVRMASGNGGYLLARWSGARGTSSRSASLGGSSGGGSGGSCQTPIPVTLGAPMSGDTSNRGGGSIEGQCVQGNAAEDVYVLEVGERTNISAVLQSSFDGVLYLQAECGRQDTELACNDDAPDTTRSEIHATVEPGRYFIVVDGYDGNAGTYQLTVDAGAAVPPDAVCGDAPPLTPGTPVRGTTQGQPDTFQATCAGGARSPDRVYRLDVPSRSRIRVRQQSDHDGALYIRSTCTAASSELACNDDANDQNHSAIAQVVDAGQYYIVTDGYGAGASGSYTLTAEIAPESGGGAVADACSGPAVAAIGTAVDVDTFAAADDTQGSCGGAGAPDVVHRVEVRSRSRLRVQLDSPQFEGAVYLHAPAARRIRRSCARASRPSPSAPPARRRAPLRAPPTRSKRPSTRVPIS